jgi:hypothetical protein
MNRRGASRLPLAPGTARLRWSELNSTHSDLVESPVTDLAVDGIGLSIEASRTPPPESGVFPAILDISGQHVSCLAQTCHRHETGNTSSYGVRLETLAGRETMIENYLSHRFPELVPRAQVDIGAMTTLLEQSGYLGLRPGMLLSADWFRLRDANRLSRDICYRANDGSFIGHVSATRAYSRAWLGHQIATLRNHPESTECRRSLYLHVAAYATLVDGEDTVMYGYFDRSKKWHKVFFYDFVKWIDDPRSAVIVELDRFERSDPGSLTGRPEPIPGFDVATPGAEELVTATALIRAQLPFLVAETLDIHPERLVSKALHESYRGSSYSRERHLLVLRDRGRLVGLCLCETGSRELSLFNLFNTAFFFFLTGPSAPRREAQLLLLAHVRTLYAARGEHNPLIVAPPDTFDATGEPGTVLAETMGLIAKSGLSLRQYECFIKYQFGKYVDRIA